MHRVPAVIAAVACILVFGLTFALLPRLKVANPGGGDVLTQVLGGTADIAASAAYTEADVYFHGGVSGGCHHDEDGCHDASDVAETHSGLPLSDLMEKLHGETAPSMHKHLQGAEQKEILPWLTAAVRLNPHLIEAWSTGTYWYYKTGETAEAERFITDGIKNNPDDYRVYMERGILYHKLGRWKEALGDLQTAKRLWKHAKVEDKYDFRAINIYTQDVLRKLGLEKDDRKASARA